MFVELSIGFLSILTLFFVYRFVDSYFRRYVGFNSMDHEPMYIRGSSSILVCVLGWGGCTRRQLRRILDFYSSQSISTVSWINPMSNYLFGIDEKPIERLLDLLLFDEDNFTEIVVHLHSNNGTLVCAQMFQMIENKSKYKSLSMKIRAIIFDSAPYVPLKETNEWILVSAVRTSRPCVGILLNRAKYFHWFWTPIVSFYLFVRLFHRRYFLPEIPMATEQIRTFLNEIPLKIVQFYLYSDADRLIPSKTIDKIIERQIQRGASVYSHRFAKTGHVNHFRFHPEEYGKLILNFFQKFVSVR